MASALKWLLLLVTAWLAGCATTPPSRPQNLCDVFREKNDWYEAARDTEKRWSVPIPVMMATMHQESRFVADARPPRKRILGFIPGPRPSDAYGYAQAIDSSWDSYRRSTGHGGADRDDFADAIDFIGWYYSQSYQRNKIGRNDAYQLYLSYHEGQGGFSRRSWEQKPWLQRVAQKVSTQANAYQLQLAGCLAELEKRASSWWF